MPMSGSCRSAECEVDASISSGLNVYPYENQIARWNTVFHSNLLLDL